MEENSRIFIAPSSKTFFRNYVKQLVIAITLLSIIILIGGLVFLLSEGFLTEFSNRTDNTESAKPSFQESKNHTQSSITVKNLNETDLRECTITKDGNPLVSDVRILENGTVGTLTGNINSINYDEATQKAVIELLSFKAEQTYTFSILEEAGLVYDAVRLEDLHLHDLKVGQTVVASFNCSSGVENSFRITRLAITGK